MDMNPCEAGPPKSQTTCTLWKLTAIVATHSLNGKPCTAFFNFSNFTWTMLEVDSRPYNIKDGIIATINNGSEVLYTGGSDKHQKDHRDIYILSDISHGWIKVQNAQMPFQIGPQRKFLPININNDFCSA